MNNVEVKDKTAGFLEKPADWRIAAVIHDGSWYTTDKWAKVAKVKEPEIKEWIEKNVKKNDGYDKKADSYRAKYDEIIRWYDEQDDIEITDKIIPNNYPPRLWGGKTEVESFLDCPLRNTATFTFETQDDEIVKKCTLALAGVGRVHIEGAGIYKAYGLSEKYMDQVVKKALTPQEYASISSKKRKNIARREMVDFDPEFTAEAIKFYIPFTRNLLQSRMSTIKMFLPDDQAIESQIIIWIIEAMRKYDETMPVPFSGYLHMSLPWWPYNLPDEQLGKELSKFQREKQKAINALSKESKEDEATFSNEQIAEKMKMDIKDYINLNSQNDAWYNEQHAAELTWEDSSNEKSGVMLGHSDHLSHDRDLSSSISVALINSALETGQYDEAFKVIHSMDAETSDDLSFLQELSQEFKLSLARNLVQEGIPTLMSSEINEEATGKQGSL